MKIKTAVFFGALIISNIANAGPQAEHLAKINVNYFQLLVNNINMLMTSGKLMEIKNNEGVEKQKKNKNDGDEMEEKFVHVGLSDADSILIETILEGPFAQVSKAKCKEKLDKIEKDARKALTSILPALSIYKLDQATIEEIVGEAAFQVTIVAKENNELKVGCSK